MFSWIIESVGRIRYIKWWLIWVECDLIKELSIWQSISHDWVCLTIKGIEDNFYEVELMPETLNRTNLWLKKPWDLINLERSMKADWRFDWYIVQGHVDTVWTLISKIQDWNSEILTIWFPQSYAPYFVEKGSVALNWISLTVISVWDDRFTVWIIPYTLSKTNLCEVKVGDKLNIETDILAKYLIRLRNYH